MSGTDFWKFINQFRLNGMFFRQGGEKLVVNSDDMTTDQKHWIFAIFLK